PVMVLTIQSRDRSLRLFVRSHLHKPKALAAARLAVRDDFGAADGAVLRKQLFQIRTRRVVAQVPNVQLAAHEISPIAGREDPGDLLSGSRGKGPKSGPRR